MHTNHVSGIDSSPTASAPALLILTGACGAGKTSLTGTLDALSLTGVACYQADTIPRWYADGSRPHAVRCAHADARHQINFALRESADGRLAVLEGQIRPSVAHAIFQELGLIDAAVVLVDCDYLERNARLRGPRNQPHLASPEMDCWAAYLRGQADALRIPRIDTTHRTLTECCEELLAYVHSLVNKQGRCQHRFLSTGADE
jgi:hypothetical protein